MTTPIPPVSVEYLTHWLREHREESTEEALRGRLLEAGHPPADVEAAFARLHAEGAVLPDATPPPAESQAGSRLPDAAPRPSPAARRERMVRRRGDWGWGTWALVIWNTLMTLFLARSIYVTQTTGLVVVCDACSPDEFLWAEFAVGFAFVAVLIALVTLWLLGLIVLAWDLLRR